MALAQPSSARVLVVKPADPDTVVATLEVPSGSTWTTAVGTGHDECATYFNAVEPEFFPSGAHLALLFTRGALCSQCLEHTDV